MTVFIQGAIGRRNGRLMLEYFVFMVEGENDSVRDNHHALEMIKEFSEPDEDGVVIFQPKRPHDDFRPVFDITVDISNTHKKTVTYQTDYKRLDGCPVAASEAMMAIYAAVKRKIRRNMLRKGNIDK